MGRSQGRKDGKGSSAYLQALFNQSSGPSALTIIEPTTRGRSKCFDFKKALTFRITSCHRVNEVVRFSHLEEKNILFPFVELMKYNPSAVCYRRCLYVLPVSAEMHVQMLCRVYLVAATIALEMLII